jgi:hypothetical protein
MNFFNLFAQLPITTTSIDISHLISYCYLPNTPLTGYNDALEFYFHFMSILNTTSMTLQIPQLFQYVENTNRLNDSSWSKSTARTARYQNLTLVFFSFFFFTFFSSSMIIIILRFGVRSIQ